MPNVEVGDVWMVDLGIAGKVRPAVVLTRTPTADELALFTIVSHTTSLRGNKWELRIPKPFLNEGAFHIQQVMSVPSAWLVRRLGKLESHEVRNLLKLLAVRLGI